MKKLKYTDFIVGYSNDGVNVTKIVDWEFREMIDNSRSWVNDKINMFMMFIIIKTDEGTFCNDFFEQKGELMKIIQKELQLNLKIQHGILK